MPSASGILPGLRTAGITSSGKYPGPIVTGSTAALPLHRADGGEEVRDIIAGDAARDEDDA